MLIRKKCGTIPASSSEFNDYVDEELTKCVERDRELMSHKQPLDTKCCFVLRASSVSEIDEPTCHKDEHLACSLGSPRPSGKRWPCASNSLFLLCIKMAKPLAFGFFLGGIVPLFGQTVRLRTVLGSMMSASHPRARRWVKIRWFNYTVWI